MIADSNMWLLAVDGAVRAKLDRIMASDYYTAAAVGGSYGAEEYYCLTRGTFSTGEPSC